MEEEFVVDVISAYKEGMQFYVKLSDMVNMPLPIFLGYVTSCRGEIIPLGMCFNPSVGVCTEIVTTFIRVPKNSHYQELLKQFIDINTPKENTPKESKDDKKPDNKKSQ